MSSCDLSILIVSWNVWELLRASLLSIERSSRPSAKGTMRQGGARDGLRSFGPDDLPAARRPTLEVIVFDNAGSDGTPQKVARFFPWVRLIASERNLGFTRGNNAAYAQARGRFVYFLNPDTELVHDRIHGDSLWTLFAAVRDDATVALAGPQLRYADNTLQSSARRFPTPLSGFFESTWTGRLWPGNPWRRRLHFRDWETPFRHDVDWVVGAAMLCRREALEQVRAPGDAGPFDEGFFMYSEETDLCRRLKAQGWRVLYVPEALVIHFEGRSSEQAVAARHLHFNTSKVRYWRKWFGPRWAERLRRFLLFEYRTQLVLERAKALVGHKRALRRQRIDAYKQVLASGLRSDE